MRSHSTIVNVTRTTIADCEIQRALDYLEACKSRLQFAEKDEMKEIAALELTAAERRVNLLFKERKEMTE